MKINKKRERGNFEIKKSVTEAGEAATGVAAETGVSSGFKLKYNVVKYVLCDIKLMLENRVFIRLPEACFGYVPRFGGWFYAIM